MLALCSVLVLGCRWWHPAKWQGGAFPHGISMPLPHLHLPSAGMLPGGMGGHMGMMGGGMGECCHLHTGR